MAGSVWLILLGILVALVSLLADPLGLGTEPRNYFGWKQIVGLVIGLVLIVYGLRRRRRA